MKHSFQMPDDIHQTLTAIAAVHGQTPEGLFEARMSEMTTHSALESVTTSSDGCNIYDPADDLLAAFPRTFEAPVPNPVRRHDDYLGVVAAETHESPY